MPTDDPQPFVGVGERAESAWAFGRRVRELRLAAGLSEEQLVNKCGVAPLAIGSTEDGRKEPQLSLILLLCDGLEISANVLLDGITIQRAP